MATFILPTQCSRCGLKTKQPSKMLFPLILPTEKPKKQGKEKIVFSYTPMVFLCKKCVLKLNQWMEEK